MPEAIVQILIFLVLRNVRARLANVSVICIVLFETLFVSLPLHGLHLDRLQNIVVKLLVDFQDRTNRSATYNVSH